MLLEIVNFRCWKKASFNFPDTGLVLLSGVSGSGKSSILNAIYFALYGIGTKILTTGEKKCSVRLCIHGFDIIRTKGPNRLLLTYEKNEYEDEVAQHIINKKFGTNFTITSYVTQKMVQSFLNMGPTDKMNFLEQLALGEENIGEIKKKAKEKIKDKKENLLQKIGQLEVISKEVGEMVKPTEIQFPLDGKYSDVKIKNESIYWKRTIKELQETNKMKRKIEDEFSKEKIQRALKDKQQKIRDSQEQKLKILLSESVEYDGDENLNDMKDTLSFLKNKREFSNINDRYIQEKKNFENLLSQEMCNLQLERDRLQDELNTIEEISEDTITKIEESISTLEKVNEFNTQLTLNRDKLSKFKKTEDIQEEIIKIENKIIDLQKEKINIEQRIIIKKCPCCKASLIILNDNLVSADGEPIDEKKAKIDITSISNDILLNKKQVDVLKKELVLLNELNKKIYKIESELLKLKTDECTDIELLRSKLKCNKEIKLERSRLIKKIKDIDISISKKELSPTLKKIQLQLATREKELNKIKTQIEEDIETDYTEEELRDEISKQLLLKQKSESLNRQIIESTKQLEIAQKELDKIILSDRNFEEEIKALSNIIVSLELKDKQHKKNYEEIQKYQEYRRKLEEYNKWETKLRLCKDEETKARKLLAITETFFKKIQEAESIAISQTIDTINYYMNFYLEKFFPDNPITVQICPYKETKKDIKPTINIEVGYKGFNTELNSLSGGEYDRVTLSIVLALNTIFGSDILMLDESIASLDTDLTNEILEVLKDSLKEKIVIVVAHQIGVGMFDNVINVSS